MASLCLTKASWVVRAATFCQLHLVSWSQLLLFNSEKRFYFILFYSLMLLFQSLTYYVGQILYEVNNINCLSQSKVFYGITTTVAQNCILWFAVEFTTITEEFQWKNRFIKTKLNKYCCLNPTQYDHCLQRWQWKWYRCK